MHGFQVASETVVMMSVMAGKSTTSSENVLSIEEIPAAEGRYDIPEDYEI